MTFYTFSPGDVAESAKFNSNWNTSIYHILYNRMEQDTNPTYYGCYICCNCDPPGVCWGDLKYKQPHVNSNIQSDVFYDTRVAGEYKIGDNVCCYNRIYANTIGDSAGKYDTKRNMTSMSYWDCSLNDYYKGCIYLANNYCDSQTGTFFRICDNFFRADSGGTNAFCTDVPYTIADKICVSFDTIVIVDNDHCCATEGCSAGCVVRKINNCDFTDCYTYDVGGGCCYTCGEYCNYTINRTSGCTYDVYENDVCQFNFTCDNIKLALEEHSDNCYCAESCICNTSDIVYYSCINTSNLANLGCFCYNEDYYTYCNEINNKMVNNSEYIYSCTCHTGYANTYDVSSCIEYCTDDTQNLFAGRPEHLCFDVQGCADTLETDSAYSRFCFRITADTYSDYIQCYFSSTGCGSLSSTYSFNKINDNCYCVCKNGTPQDTVDIRNSSSLCYMVRTYTYSGNDLTYAWLCVQTDTAEKDSTLITQTKDYESTKDKVLFAYKGDNIDESCSYLNVYDQDDNLYANCIEPNTLGELCANDKCCFYGKLIVCNTTDQPLKLKNYAILFD